MSGYHTEWRLHMIRQSNERSHAGLVCRGSFLRACLPFVSLLLVLPAANAAAQMWSETGRWQGTFPLGAPYPANAIYGAHVALLKGPADTTRALLFGQSGAMGFWSFVPTTSLTIPKTKKRPFPIADAPDESVNVHDVKPPDKDLFCAGHAFANGRLIVVGGQYLPTTGVETPYEFNPLYSSLDPTPPPVTPPWRVLASSARGRWYPSVTSLSTGQLLASSGTKFGYVWTFGGSTGALQKDVRWLGIGNTVEWSNPATPPPPNPTPSERKDHTAIMHDHKAINEYKKQMVVFGGQTGPDQTPPTLTLKSNEVWAQYLEESSDSTTYWQPYTANPHAGVGLPVPRSRHTAIYYAPNSGNQIMVVYGGRDQSGDALGDVWKFEFDHPNAATDEGTWTRLLENSDLGPDNRYGHTAILDPGLTGTPPRMLVFGGRTSATSLALPTVWSLNLTNPPHVWTEVIPISGGPPTAREGHSAVGDSYGDQVLQQSKFRMVIFGGHDGATPRDDTWSLWRQTDQNDWTWEQVQPQAGYPAPPHRWRHAATRDGLDRMVVFGGEGQAGLLNDLWSLDLGDIEPGSSTSLRWSPALVKNQNDAPAARAGHTAVPDSRAIVERFPEVFSPGVVESPGAWTSLPITAAKKQHELYPFMFMLPSGNVLDAGPATTTQVLNTSSWTWGGDRLVDSPQAGSAVMYRPGSVLRCGTIGADLALTVSDTDTIRFSGPTDATGGWMAVGGQSLIPRKFHNLTLLPTGDVLVSGGLQQENLASAVRKPQIWSRATGSWNTYDLAEDPAVRNYHSAAILLPCGRILSTGGERTQAEEENPNATTATIFEPPYLFSGNAPATRPTITNVPCRISYGTEFFIRTPDMATMTSGTVCLIRPGAVTHSFNQDQRYVPLNMYACASTGRLRIVAPAGGEIAPPGDYLLFIVNNAGVPSIGRWVRVGTSLPPGCDVDVPNRVDPPNPVAEVIADNEIWFYWPAPWDNPGAQTGTVAEYDVRASTGAMTNDALFCQGLPGSALLPLSGGGGWQYGWVSGLSSCTQYHFALKARDGAENWSPISNEIVETTLCWGGGGGFSAQPVATLAGAVSALTDEGGGRGRTSLLPSGATSDGAEPLALATQTASGWAVEMGLSNDAPVWSVYALAEQEARTLFAGDSAGIVVQGPEEQGRRLTRARLFPGATSTRFALRRLHQPGRLVFRGQLEFRQAWGTVASGTPGEAYVVASARHSRLGDQTAAMDLAGITTTTLAPDDTLSLRYEKSTSNVEEGSDWFMLIGQPGTVAPIAGSRPALQPEAPTLPAAFALYANQPNPFARLTTLRFALPRSGHVRLEVFDLLGRRVRTVADATFEAGEHTVPWDGRDAQGVLLSAGVYVARIHAGEFRAQRTMVLLPSGR